MYTLFVINKNACRGKCKHRNKESGNCKISNGKDGNIVQCVGEWAEDKYFFLMHYIEATKGARQKYSRYKNSIFIDLFSGPGKCIVRNSGKEIDGGALRVLNHYDVPFTEYYLIDTSSENIAAFKLIVGNRSEVTFFQKDSNVFISELIELLNSGSKYHVVYADPFGPEALKFSTIKALSVLQRLDIIIHFPIGPIKRNLKSWIKKDSSILSEFLGTERWRSEIVHIPSSGVTNYFIQLYKNQLIENGFPTNGLEVGDGVPVKNSKEVEMYKLILASKHPLGQKIWGSVKNYQPDGQKSLF